MPWSWLSPAPKSSRFQGKTPQKAAGTGCTGAHALQIPGPSVPMDGFTTGHFLGNIWTLASIDADIAETS
jgi:hypothetical protein